MLDLVFEQFWKGNEVKKIADNTRMFGVVKEKSSAMSSAYLSRDWQVKFNGGKYKVTHEMIEIHPSIQPACTTGQALS